MTTSSLSGIFPRTIHAGDHIMAGDEMTNLLKRFHKLECRVEIMEERMATVDDLLNQFQAALDTLTSELTNAISNEDQAVVSRLQPIADKFTALASNPAGSGVPAAADAGSGSTTGGTTDTSGGTATGGTTDTSGGSTTDTSGAPTA